MTTEEEKKNWWQRLDAQFRLTLIAGGFVIAAALCAGLFQLTSLFIERILNSSPTDIPPNVSIWYEIETYENPLIAAIPNDEGYFLVSSGTCLNVLREDGILISKITPTQGNFTGVIEIFIQTNISIVIHGMQLIVTDFTPLSTQDDIRLGLPGRGGGGFVEDVTLPDKLIVPNPKIYDLLGARYELSENETVSFLVPISVKEPGTYTYNIEMDVTTLSNIAVEPAYNQETSTFKWVFVKDIDPREIFREPGNYYFELCK